MTVHFTTIGHEHHMSVMHIALTGYTFAIHSIYTFRFVLVSCVPVQLCNNYTMTSHFVPSVYVAQPSDMIIMSAMVLDLCLSFVTDWKEISCILMGYVSSNQANLRCFFF